MASSAPMGAASSAMISWRCAYSWPGLCAAREEERDGWAGRKASEAKLAAVSVVRAPLAPRTHHYRPPQQRLPAHPAVELRRRRGAKEVALDVADGHGRDARHGRLVRDEHEVAHHQHRRHVAVKLKLRYGCQRLTQALHGGGREWGKAVSKRCTNCVPRDLHTIGAAHSAGAPSHLDLAALGVEDHALRRVQRRGAHRLVLAVLPRHGGRQQLLVQAHIVQVAAIEKRGGGEETAAGAAVGRWCVQPR